MSVIIQIILKKLDSVNRTYFALFVAILIHIIFFLLYYLLESSYTPMQKPKEKEHRIKVSLKELHSKKPAQTIHKAKRKQMPHKKVTKQKVLKHKIKKIIKKHTLKKKVVKKMKMKKVIHKRITKLPTKRTLLQKPQPKKKIVKQKEQKSSKSSLFNILSQDYSQQTQPTHKNYSLAKQNAIQQNIKELYGDTFKTLSKNQQEYIIDNQEIMRRITQRVLNRVARVNLDRNLQVNSSNIVEFYLYPNGNISDLHFLSKSSMFLLDETTKETIEYAYSQYPRPKEKTLIRYNVFYNLAR